MSGSPAFNIEANKKDRLAKIIAIRMDGRVLFSFERIVE